MRRSSSNLSIQRKDGYRAHSLLARAPFHHIHNVNPAQDLRQTVFDCIGCDLGGVQGNWYNFFSPTDALITPRVRVWRVTGIIEPLTCRHCGGKESVFP